MITKKDADFVVENNDRIKGWFCFTGRISLKDVAVNGICFLDGFDKKMFIIKLKK